MNHANIMFETYDNDYNTMYRYYYGAVANTYTMSTHTRFPDSELYNKPLEQPKHAWIDILYSYKEQYPNDEWKLLEDEIAQEGQRLLEEEQEERFFWQEPRNDCQTPQKKLSLMIPKDEDDELTDVDECQELTDVDYIEQNHELNIFKMANLNYNDDISSSSNNMSIVSCNDYDDSSSQDSRDSWTRWYKARIANGYYDSK